MDGLQEKSVTSRHGKTYYLTNDRSGAAPGDLALVFLPGLTADHRLFRSQLAFLGKDYKVLVWDCPCHGKSRPYDDFSYANVSRELARILEQEKVSKAVFVGQSLGGMIAQYYIDRHPEQAAGFVAVDSAPFGDYYSKSDFFWLSQLEWMCKLFPDRLLRTSMAKMCAVTAAARENMTDMLSVYSKKELCRLIYLGEAAFIPENKKTDLPCEALLILGEKDKIGKVAAYNREWARRTGFPLVTIPGAAHNANDDAPEAVNKAILAFVKGLGRE